MTKRDSADYTAIERFKAGGLQLPRFVVTR
jgi:hypothetical protein